MGEAPHRPGWLVAVRRKRGAAEPSGDQEREEVAASAHRRRTPEMTAPSGAARDGWLSTGINGSAEEGRRRASVRKWRPTRWRCSVEKWSERRTLGSSRCWAANRARAHACLCCSGGSEAQQKRAARWNAAEKRRPCLTQGEK
jgi:hypothetical protein